MIEQLPSLSLFSASKYLAEHDIKISHPQMLKLVESGLWAAYSTGKQYRVHQGSIDAYIKLYKVAKVTAVDELHALIDEIRSTQQGKDKVLTQEAK